MKTLAFLFFSFAFWTHSFSQNLTLKIIGNSDFESKVIDSLSYNSNPKNAKNLSNEINFVSESLSKSGFIENQLLENTKENDSSYVAKFSLGEKINSIHIYIGENSELNNWITLDTKKDSLILPYSQVELFLNGTLKKMEQNGFAFAKLKLVNFQKKKKVLHAELQFESGKQRLLSSIVVKFAESEKKNSFPEGHLKQINRRYRNTTFNQEIVRKIYTDFDEFRFVNQIRKPEILFTKDTTKVYVYLEKRKSNAFDGFIGFSNNEKNKLVFNGYLDLALENSLQAGEQFLLYWKNDGKNQQTFKVSVDFPYLFKSPIGLKAQLYIFKQDSIYQNAKTAIDLGYLLDYNTRIYLGYQSTESSDIQNTNSISISDYKSSFLTTNLEYSKLDFVNTIFPKKTNLSMTIGLGSRSASGFDEAAGSCKQVFININAMHNFYFDKKNSVNVNYQNYFLKSETYIINELYRFGGVNSIRGFAENSLQAHFMTAINTEYRYIVSPDLYLHSILDYGYYQDDTSNTKGNLMGFGLGLGLQTKNGLLKLALANGSTGKKEVKFHNTFVTMAYNVKF